MYIWQLILILLQMIAYEIQSMYYPSLKDQYPNNENFEKGLKQRHVSDLSSGSFVKNKERKEKKGFWWTLPIPPVELEYEPDKYPGFFSNNPSIDKDQIKLLDNQHKCPISASQSVNAQKPSPLSSLKAITQVKANLATTSKSQDSSNSPVSSKDKAKLNALAKQGHSGLSQQKLQGIVGEKRSMEKNYGSGNIITNHDVNNKLHVGSKVNQGRAHFTSGNQQGNKELTSNIENPQQNDISLGLNNENYFAHSQNEPQPRGLISDSQYDQRNLQYNEELPRMCRIPQYSNGILSEISASQNVLDSSQNNVQLSNDFGSVLQDLDESLNSNKEDRCKRNFNSENIVIS